MSTPCPGSGRDSNSFLPPPAMHVGVLLAVFRLENTPLVRLGVTHLDDSGTVK
jgi:hypothetical protein